MNRLFSRLASACSSAAGSPWAFIISVASVVAWAAAGPIFDYSDTWQLVVNTATTVITFFLVFIIQHTQNRDTRALQAKLDELISATSGARDSMIYIENKGDEKIESERKDPAREGDE